MASSTHTKPLAIGDAAPRLWVAVSTSARCGRSSDSTPPCVSLCGYSKHCLDPGAARARVCSQGLNIPPGGAPGAPPPFTF